MPDERSLESTSTIMAENSAVDFACMHTQHQVNALIKMEF